MAFILRDELFERDPVSGNLHDPTIGKYFDNPNAKYYGHAICLVPFETFTSLNPTTPVGMTTGLMISLSFQLKKWEFASYKVDEWIEVNPTYNKYYQVTIKEKESIEHQIKQGLSSAAQAVADLELLKHDQRKYKEFLHYLGLEYEGGKFIDKKEGKDEHSLKAVFIDQVDAHSGEGISMRSIVSRWPTLIVDFQKIDDEDIEVDKIKEKLDVSKAEAVVISTKNRLYREWKQLFVPEIKGRYERIMQLIRSREASVENYRNWLKPHIARHKLLNEGLEHKKGRDLFKTSDIYQVGAATSFSSIKFWTWRDFEPVEAFRHGGSEQLAKERAEGKLKAYDEWTKKHLIFHPEHGLITDYPWITDKWAGGFQETFYQRRWMLRNKLYYSFFPIDFLKGSFKTATGEEFDDSIFNITAIYMSENVLYTKLLELEAKKVDFNHYVDRLIGVIDPECQICKHETGGSEKAMYDYKESVFEKMNNILKEIGLGMSFFKKGPYERDFDERITKLHLSGMAGIRYAPIVKFIKDSVGYGVS